MNMLNQEFVQYVEDEIISRYASAAFHDTCLIGGREAYHLYLGLIRDIIHDPERYRGIFENFYEEER